LVLDNNKLPNIISLFCGIMNKDGFHLFTLRHIGPDDKLLDCSLDYLLQKRITALIAVAI
jgi:hypothetical protein